MRQFGFLHAMNVIKIEGCICKIAELQIEEIAKITSCENNMGYTYSWPLRWRRPMVTVLVYIAWPVISATCQWLVINVMEILNWIQTKAIVALSWLVSLSQHIRWLNWCWLPVNHFLTPAYRRVPLVYIYTRYNNYSRLGLQLYPQNNDLYHMVTDL